MIQGTRNVLEAHTMPEPVAQALAELGGYYPGGLVTADQKRQLELENVARDHIKDLNLEVIRLNALLDTPHTGEFFQSVRIEAGHQVKRWGTEHDEHKEPSDWFWLLGYLAGKAVSKPEKRKHHIISSAAVLLNWYRRETGDELTFRPGADTQGV